MKLAVCDGRTLNVDVRGGEKVNRAVSSDNDPLLFGAYRLGLRGPWA